MACSNHWKIDKIDKLFICLLLIFICIFEFFTTFVFASDIEYLDFESIYGLSISSDANYFQSGSGILGYVLLEKGYIYTIEVPESYLSARQLVVSHSVPAVNVPYTFLANVSPGQKYSYIVDDSNDYLYFDFAYANSDLPIYRQKIVGLDCSIDDLVNNVGFSQLWSIFDTSVNFIVVVVLFAIGVFLIISFIRKGSKGKSVF